MANEVEILIKATASGAGASETAAQLDKVAASANQAAAATRELTEAEKEQVAANVQTQPQRGLDSTQMAAMQRMAEMEAEAGEQEEARGEAIKRQRQEIWEMEQERVALVAQGDTEEAAKLEEIVAARKMALTLQQQAGIAEEEANVQAEQYIARKAEADAAEAARVEAIAAERATIANLENAAVLARANGEEALAATLEREAEVRATALRMVKEQGVTEAEALRNAEARVAAEEAITAQKEAQAALDAESAATGDFRGIGQMGRGAGMLGGALGLGAGMAGAVGLGAFGGYEAYEYINRQTEAIQKEIEAQQKLNAEFDKQYDTLSRSGTSEQWETAIADVHEKLQAAIEARQTAEGAEADKLDDEIESLRVQEGLLDNGARQAAARKETEDAIVTSIKSQTAAIGEQQKAWEAEEGARNQAFEAANKQASLETEHAKLLIDLQVAQGKMTPEEGDKQKADQDEKAARDQFQRQQDKANQTIQQYQADLKTAQDQAKQAQNDLDVANVVRSAVNQRVNRDMRAQDDHGAAQIAADKAQADYQKALDEGLATGMSQSDVDSFPAVADLKKRAQDAAATASAAGEAAEQANDLKAAQDALAAETTRAAAMAEKVRKANDAVEQAQGKADQIPGIQAQIKSDADAEKTREGNAELKGQIEAAKAAAKAAEEQARKAREDQMKQIEAQMRQREEELRAQYGDKGLQDHLRGDQQYADLKTALATQRDFGNPDALASDKAAIQQDLQAAAKAEFDAMVKQFGTPDQQMSALLSGAAGLTSQPWNDNKALGDALAKAEQAQKSGDNQDEQRLLERIVDLLTSIGEKSTKAADKQKVATLEAKVERLESWVKNGRQ